MYSGAMLFQFEVMFGVGKILELSQRNLKKRVVVYDTAP